MDIVKDTEVIPASQLDACEKNLEIISKVGSLADQLANKLKNIIETSCSGNFLSIGKKSDSLMKEVTDIRSVFSHPKDIGGHVILPATYDDDKSEYIMTVLWHDNIGESVYAGFGTSLMWDRFPAGWSIATITKATSIAERGYTYFGVYKRTLKKLDYALKAKLPTEKIPELLNLKHGDEYDIKESKSLMMALKFAITTLRDLYIIEVTASRTMDRVLDMLEHSCEVACDHFC